MGVDSIHTNSYRRWRLVPSQVVFTKDQLDLGSSFILTTMVKHIQYQNNTVNKRNTEEKDQENVNFNYRRYDGDSVL